MSESPWKRGFKDWWFVGRGWFVRALCMAVIGAAIVLLGRRVMAHWPQWLVGLVAGGGAAFSWGLVTLI
jgi:hypothetical protein